MEIRIDSKIRMVPIGEIKPYAKNAKKHPQSQIDRLAEHIQQVGWDQPIVVDENMEILKGHGRLAVAKKLGMTEVPIVDKHGLSESMKKACRLADNKLAESEWDIDLLAEELNEIKLDVDLSGIGFDADSLKDLDIDLDADDEGGKRLSDEEVAEIEGDIKMSDEIEVDKEFLLIVFDDDKTFALLNELLNNDFKCGYWLSKHKTNPAFFRRGPNRVISGDLLLKAMKNRISGLDDVEVKDAI